MFNLSKSVSIFFFLCVSVNIVQESRGALGARYNYAHPEYWSTEFSQCGGERQSPLAVSTKDFDVEFEPLKLSGLFTKPSKMKVYNSGNHVVVNFTYDSNPLLGTGGPVGSAVYKAARMVIFWGSTNDVGSQHTVDGKRYPMEVHMLAFNTKYDSFDAALVKEDGILGVTKLVGIVDESEQDKVNQAMEAIVPELPKIREVLEEADVDPFPVGYLMPPGDKAQKEMRYIVYNGSMTMPPCQESVIWMITINPIYVTQSMVDEFRKTVLFDNDEKNYRPLQERNSRSFGKLSIPI